MSCVARVQTLTYLWFAAVLTADITSCRLIDNLFISAAFESLAVINLQSDEKTLSCSCNGLKHAKRSDRHHVIITSSLSGFVSFKFIYTESERSKLTIIYYWQDVSCTSPPEDSKH